MGVKYTQLPSATTIAANDQIAVLDVSENVLKKMNVSHSSETDEFGLGNQDKFGHVKVVDSLTSVEFVPGEALSAYQGKVLSDTVSNISQEVIEIKGGDVELAVNPSSTENMNIWIETF